MSDPEPAASPPSLVLVDDHELFRDGLREVLNEHGFEIVGQAPDPRPGLKLAFPEETA